MFGKKKKKPQPKKTGAKKIPKRTPEQEANAKRVEAAMKEIMQNPIRWHSNAPSHWPKIITLPLIVEERSLADVKKNNMFFFDALKEVFEKTKCGCTVSPEPRSLLTPDGIFEITYMVYDNGKEIPIIFIPMPSPQAALHYFETKELCQKRGLGELVYFAPQPIPDKKELPQMDRKQFSIPFHPGTIKHLGKEVPDGDYSVWISSVEEPIFHNAPIFSKYNSYHKAASGIESYILAKFLKSWGMVDATVLKAKLPKHTIIYHVVGPEEKLMLIVVSEQIGINFHFNSETTSIEYRNNFMSLFAAWTESFRTEVIKQNLPMDYEGDSPSLINWVKKNEEFKNHPFTQAIEKNLNEGGDKVPVMAFGSITIPLKEP